MHLIEEQEMYILVPDLQISLCDLEIAWPLWTLIFSSGKTIGDLVAEVCDNVKCLWFWYSKTRQGATTLPQTS